MSLRTYSDPFLIILPQSSEDLYVTLIKNLIDYSDTDYISNTVIYVSLKVKLLL